MKVILFQPQQDTISVKDSQSTGEATTPASCKGRVATYPEKIVFNQFLTLLLLCYSAFISNTLVNEIRKSEYLPKFNPNILA